MTQQNKTASTANINYKWASHPLVDMLQYKRKHLSTSEEAYISRFIRPACDRQDEAGNLILEIKNPDGTKPDILFSSHTDSVHNSVGTQLITVSNNGTVSLPANSPSNCLGADDATGNYIMLKLIEACVPGLYIFHRGEECGGIGSTHIADNTPELLKDINIAVAFDRHYYSDVIIRQSWGRCASDEFATQLGDMIGMAPADGVFTDTANYTRIIPECTNISVGYIGQHTVNETQDLPFVNELVEKLISLDWKSLQIHRNPADADDHWDSQYFASSTPQTWDTLYQYVCNHPEDVTDLLMSYGISAQEIMEETSYYPSYYQ